MELAVENPRHMSVVKIGETPAPSGAAREELLALARDWLLADPDLPFRRARKAAKNLSLALTSRLYAEARRSLGITAGPPRPSQRKPAPVVAAEFTKDAPMAAAEKTKTPMMAFVVEYLRSAPDATYADLKSAAAQKGFKIAPIVFGRARKELGFSAMRDAKPARTATRNPAAVAAAQVASPAAPPRSGRALGVRRRSRRHARAPSRHGVRTRPFPRRAPTNRTRPPRRPLIFITRPALPAA